MTAQSIASILEKLQQPELRDRVFAVPLNERETGAIENEVGLKMPKALRETLAAIGIRQDLINGHTSDFMWFERASSFAFIRREMLEIFGDMVTLLFPLGTDGAGNYYALDTSTGEGDTIVFVDHEVYEVSPYMSLSEWLDGVIASASAGAKEREKNSNKELVVEFSFDSSQLPDVVALISQVCTVEDLDGGWRDRDECESFVKHLRSMKLNGTAVLFQLTEYKNFNKPPISFKYREPAMTPPDQSLIAKLKEVCESSPFAVKIFEWGVFPREK